MTNSRQANHLINETSPYLLQHAYNPVDWYPWGEQALSKAREENKPLLLSIGYAACHWCHVMAHESFEDNETAALMNELFINVKVDREERPDLDKIYQTSHFLLTQQHGGWPLTVFISPDDLAPFFSGTYFPVRARHQLPAFKDVMRAVADLYHHRSADIKQQNAGLFNILNPPSAVITDARLNMQPLQHATQVLERQFDSFNGGFGGAPKFPQAPKLEYLLSSETPIVPFTLQHMAAGGIYDHLAGGFYRYTVDAKWHIPHFEKMLYDNAQLLYLYARVASEYNDAVFAKIARETAEWTIATMQSAEGGYYSSLDADSDGHEGKYYIWDQAELKSLLSADETAVIKAYYGLNQPPNFEKSWHFYIAHPLDQIATDLSMSAAEMLELLTSAKMKLLSARSKRNAPALDDKILTSWNALMIKGMFTAGEILQEPAFTDSALRAVCYIYQHHWNGERLIAVSKDGKGHLHAYLDDYAFLIDALLTLLQTTWRSEHMEFAIQLTDVLLTRFQDKNEGGFYFTAENQEKLFYRPKTMTDEAIPSGNGVAARVMLILGYLLGDSRYFMAAEKTLQAAWPVLTHHPAEHCTLLSALKEYLEPPMIIIIRGPEMEISEWARACKKPGNYVFAIPDDIKSLPDALSEKKLRGKICAYVCQGTQCLDVIQDFDRLLEVIKSDSK